MTAHEKDLAEADAGWNAGLRGLYPSTSKRLADYARLQAAEIERLRAALKATESDLFYQIEAKHGPRAASEYPAIKLALEALEHGNE